MEADLKSGNSFRAGMYLLENLTSGMYNDPLSVYREYIQNAVDSIDVMQTTQTVHRDEQLMITIDIDPREKSITILDNAMGISSELAEGILSGIGISEKTDFRLRGFRGIGRLGGIAFSDRAIFRTKAKGEKVESVQEWDCKGLRTLISQFRENPLSIAQVFERTTKFSLNNSKLPIESYFEVKLYGVSSFRNYILDVRKVKSYLKQVAPVQFNHVDFPFFNQINHYLASNLNHYGSYNIALNAENIYKPYHERVKLTKGGTDIIKGIKLFEINNGSNGTLAYGWYGQRKDLLGSIIKGDDSSGIRVRVGNIMLGDAHLLDGCFREARFNSYLIGEVHVDSNELIPNSRRDDFIDNKYKHIFYNGIEKEIGLLLSKEVRSRSKIKSDFNKFSSSQRRGIDIDEKKETPLGPTGEVNTTEAGESALKKADQIMNNELHSDFTENGLHANSKNPFSDILILCCNGCPNLPKIIEAIIKE